MHEYKRANMHNNIKILNTNVIIDTCVGFDEYKNPQYQHLWRSICHLLRSPLQHGNDRAFPDWFAFV